MIRSERFLISQKPFALDLSTLTGEQTKAGDYVIYRGTVAAVWYRRKSGVTRACIGTLHLWSHSLAAPLDLDAPQAVLTVKLDSRYGGDCIGRWDGENYWGHVPLAVQEQHLAVLRPMLADYPTMPDGYDGWWRF